MTNYSCCAITEIAGITITWMSTDLFLLALLDSIKPELHMSFQNSNDSIRIYTHSQRLYFHIGLIICLLCDRWTIENQLRLSIIEA